MQVIAVSPAGHGDRDCGDASEIFDVITVGIAMNANVPVPLPKIILAVKLVT